MYLKILIMQWMQSIFDVQLLQYKKKKKNTVDKRLCNKIMLNKTMEI